MKRWRTYAFIVLGLIFIGFAVLGFRQVLIDDDIIAPPAPTADEALAAHIFDTTFEVGGKIEPNGPISLSGQSAAYWRRHLTTTPHCGKNGDEVFDFEEILTNRGWTPRITCGSDPVFGIGARKTAVNPGFEGVPMPSPWPRNKFQAAVPASPRG